jgi:hypothetical protein
MMGYASLFYQVIDPLIRCQSGRSVGVSEESDRCTPTSEGFAGQRIGHHVRVFGKNRMYGAPQVANPLAVNDPHSEDVSFLTRSQVIKQEFFYLAWLEGVQVKHAINRQLDGFVHVESKIDSFRQKGKD